MQQAHLLDHVAGFDMFVGKKHDAHQQHQQEDVYDVERPGSTQYPHRRNEVTVAQGNFAVGKHRRVAREEYEDFGRVTEAEVTQGQVAQRVLRNVIPEYEDQGQSTKKVDPVVSSVSHGSAL